MLDSVVLQLDAVRSAVSGMHGTCINNITTTNIIIAMGSFHMYMHFLGCYWDSWRYCACVLVLVVEPDDIILLLKEYDRSVDGDLSRNALHHKQVSTRKLAARQAVFVVLSVTCLRHSVQQPNALSHTEE